MKKSLLILLALVMVLTLSLTACGGNETPSDTDNGNASGPSAQADDSDADSTSNEAGSADDNLAPSGGNDVAVIDTSTVAGYLSQFGLTEEDIAIGSAAENVLYADSRIIEITTETIPTTEELQSCVEHIYEKCRSVSEDGKIHMINSDNEFILSDVVDWTLDWQSSPLALYWSYKYEGNTVDVFINWSATDMTALAFYFAE